MPTNSNQTPVLESSPVRIFFSLLLNYVIPAMPSDKAMKGSGTKWEAAKELRYFRSFFCMELATEIEKKLELHGFSVYFKKIERTGRNGRASSVSFVISRLHEFPSNELSVLAMGDKKVKARPADAVTKKFQSEITQALEGEFYIARLARSYMASREYVFEIFYAGNLVVKRKFSDSELQAYGTVAEALSTFQEEISSHFEPNFCVYPYQTNLTRRPRNNQYTFEVSASPTCSFGERQVCGPGSKMIDWEGTTDEFNSAEVEWMGDDLDSHTEILESEFNAACDLLPTSVKVIESTINFIDWNDDAVDVVDLVRHD